jgi:hypothetical protein
MRWCSRFQAAGALLVGLALCSPSEATEPTCRELLGSLTCPTGDDVPYGYRLLSEGIDPILSATLEKYFKARIDGDVDTLLELTVSLSFDHQDVELDRHRHAIDTLPLRGYLNCAVGVDESNPWHVWIFTPSVVTLAGSGECVRSAFVTQWILLDGKWYTFPAGAPILSGAKKQYRPNAIRRGNPLSDEDSDELQRLIEGAIAKEPSN